jgi:hypothetical protein
VLEMVLDCALVTGSELRSNNIDGSIRIRIENEEIIEGIIKRHYA